MNPTFDSDGYPSDETLALITYWYRNDGWTPTEFLEFCETAFNKHYGRWEIINDYNKLSAFKEENFKALEIATGGWSGNEMIISVMEKTPFWSVFWRASFSGGLYVLKLQQCMNISEFERGKPVVTMHKINDLIKRIEDEKYKTESLYKDRVRSLDTMYDLLVDIKDSFKKGE